MNVQQIISLPQTTTYSISQLTYKQISGEPYDGQLSRTVRERVVRRNAGFLVSYQQIVQQRKKIRKTMRLPLLLQKRNGCISKKCGSLREPVVLRSGTDWTFSVLGSAVGAIKVFNARYDPRWREPKKRKSQRSAFRPRPDYIRHSELWNSKAPNRMEVKFPGEQGVHRLRGQDVY
eukprot:TRINITY_DN32_c0_g1_i2.p5 TRINITY_DN32_c0_g1~~TRINITY_DN32_c0_g1_i2.p5  ORF type:complete len:176 (+),score=7.34 TRINITY_DN32_c0_g1_i2:951-1478(+)